MVLIMDRNNVMPIHGRQSPLGVTRAISCRDAGSLARDGEPFLEFNTIDTADGCPLVQVRFADGQRLLADPTTDLIGVVSNPGDG